MFFTHYYFCSKHNQEIGEAPRGSLTAGRRVLVRNLGLLYPTDRPLNP